LKYKWITKREIDNFLKINARLHVVTEKGYKDEYRFDVPQLEACIFIIHQEQAFEAVFQMKIICG
jgi:hypothetical protein